MSDTISRLGFCLTEFSFNEDLLGVAATGWCPYWPRGLHDVLHATWTYHLTSMHRVHGVQCVLMELGDACCNIIGVENSLR